MRIYVKAMIAAAVLLLAIPVKAQSTTGLNLYRSGMDEAAVVFFKKVCASNAEPKEKAEACYYIANAFIRMGQPDSGMVYFDKGISEDPTYSYNNIGKTGLTTLTTDPKEAEKVFKQAISEDKKNMDVYLAVARAYISQKDYENANKYIDRAIKVNSKSGLPYMLKGDIARLQDKPMDAASQYEQATYFSPELLSSYLKYAAIYMLLNKELALTTLQQAQEQADNAGEKFTGIDAHFAELYYRQGKMSDAVTSYAKFIEDGNYTENHLLNYALYLYMDKRYDEARPIIIPVLEKDPNHFVANRIYAYVEAKTQTGAIDLIGKFIANAPKDKIIALDYIALAEEQAESNLYNDAAESYKNAIKLDTNRKFLYQDIADMYAKEKEIDSSVKYYDLYADVAGREDLVVLFKYGRSLYSMTSNLDSTMRERQIFYLKKADTIFQLLSEIAPDNYLGYFWRARVNSLIDMETTEGLAKPYYEKVIEICLPDADKRKRELSESYRYFGYYYYVQAEAKAIANKNNAKAAKEEYLKAKEYFSNVLEVDPTDPTAAQAIEAIDKLNLEK
ncbi:MAG: tetratricopeptide repeat protein [Bacteroidales bacterium]|jgi:tetratricopeptide (TPR) repeat protein|nr:tetratricopeptide repeat protein [Bacteroidales bacterium]